MVLTNTEPVISNYNEMKYIAINIDHINLALHNALYIIIL